MGRVRELGIAGSLARIKDKLVGQPRTLVFMRLTLPRMEDHSSVGADFHLVTSQEVMGWSAYDDGYFTREQALCRLESGCQLYVLQRQGRNVCFGWAERGTVDMRWLNLRLCLPDDVVYLSCLYTPPQFRRQSCAFRLWRAVAHHWKERGATCAIVAVNPQNAPSLWLHERVGFKTYQTITYRRWPGLGCYTIQHPCGRLRRRYTMACTVPTDLWSTFWSSVILEAAWLTTV